MSKFYWVKIHKNKLGQDSPFPKFLHLKIRRRNGVESLTILEEGEFKFAIDGCITVMRMQETLIEKHQTSVLPKMFIAHQIHSAGLHIQIASCTRASLFLYFLDTFKLDSKLKVPAKVQLP